MKTYANTSSLSFSLQYNGLANHNSVKKDLTVSYLTGMEMESILLDS